MNLFSRTATVDPAHAVEAMGFAVEIGRYVAKATGMELGVWTVLYGAPVGTVSWSARVDSHAAMGAATATLAADAEYQRRLTEAAPLFAGPIEDLFLEFVATAGPGRPVGDVVSIVTAGCANGQIGAAMAWGVDIMQHVAGVTGNDVSFVRSLY